MKISINKPCHENWDNMLPDEKGAFCFSCQKSVIDFSNKTLGQIKDFFNRKPASESVCGRFEVSQLTALSFDDFFAEFKTWKLARKVALIVFFVFGLSLFSAAQTKPKPTSKVEQPMMMGDIALPIDTLIRVKDTLTSTDMMTGKIKVEPEPPRKKPQPSTKTMGEPEVAPRRQHK